ncbi:MAG TPA: DUF2793 domain-containing protein [Allosphingosinicella sp.]|jgi:hypothetical protein|nr:DUF2793 domain-containing protein [Allosphingosinicella sp.]
MTDSTPRFALPFILPGQAQKEHFHNEALVRIDAALHPAVEGPPASLPPTTPAAGQCWIVAPSATGDWVGRDDMLAMWTESGWRFLAPAPGTIVWDKDAGLPLLFDGTGWRQGELPCAGLFVGGVQVVGERQPAVPSPSGGTIIDAEARAAINALTEALMSHGLIE